MSDAHGQPKKKKDFRAMVHAGAHVPHHEEGESWLVSYADMMTLLVGFFVILQSFSSADEGKFEKLKKALSQEFGGMYVRPFGDLADRLKTILEKAGLGDQFIIKENASGVEISFRGTVFFDTGSASMKEEGLASLEKLIPVVKTEAADFNLFVEGYTDDVPIAAGGVFRNNWELSSIRACRVLKAFLDNGFDTNRITAVGYGESRPVVANRDANGVGIPENQSQNRRVVIRLEKRVATSLTTPPAGPAADAAEDTEKETEKDGEQAPPQAQVQTPSQAPAPESSAVPAPSEPAQQ